jgi:D-alanyl-lipoteichoic acid acyltransferase DltB (MBOAT superfamily)
MPFNGYAYLLLLIPVVSLYWLLPHRLRQGYLLAASFLYYASWNLWHTPLPVLVCLLAWIAGRGILAHPDRKGWWLRAGIASVLLVLCFYKYRAWIWTNLSAALLSAGAGPLPELARLALPLGISFYTFEAISYLIDTSQGRVKTASLFDLSLFVAFWPHLMAGPIVRVRELIPQFHQEKKFDAAQMMAGLDRLILGLVQKNVFANNLSGFVEEGFLPQAAASNSFLDNWTLAFAFGLQVYFDFAAYSNMAIGASRLLGITLPENFRFPYHAASPPDFWGRWHMTLSRWIRDYLFFPLNVRFQGSSLPLYASLIGVMGLVGLWHGAGWGYVAWGLMHGLWLVLYRVWEKMAEGGARKWMAAAPTRWAWRWLTLAAVMLSWIPFRAATLGQAGVQMKTMLTQVSFRASYNVNFYLVTGLICVVALAEPYLAAGFAKLDSRPSRRWMILRPLLYAAGLLFFMIFDDLDTQFIYFQF